MKVLLIGWAFLLAMTLFNRSKLGVSAAIEVEDDDDDDDAGSSATATNALTGSGSVTSYCSDPSSTFCVTLVRDTTTQLLTVTMSSSLSSGWLGLGIGGETMRSCNYYLIAYPTSNKASYTVSQRVSGGGRSQPVLSSSVLPQTYTLLPQGLQPKTNASIPMAVSFTIPLNSTNPPPISSSGPTMFIYASSSTGPANPDSPASSFAGMFIKFSNPASNFAPATLFFTPSSLSPSVSFPTFSCHLIITIIM
jgi:hypothetical protein